ncbi:hypothetical protein CIB48_g9091 [Xylaria polymorpha]|nr:hypothetical protein CIB48_g9091 [Xylaria polymorpha]
MSDDERETKPFKFVTDLVRRRGDQAPYRLTDLFPPVVSTRIALIHSRPGVDARFPNQNQTKHCWQNYVDYHKCINSKGEDFAPCRQFFLAYRSLCPSGWYQRWDDQRESGNFPAKLDA